MTDMIKLAYEQGQMQALADLGLIKDAGFMDKVRGGWSRLSGMFRKKPVFSSDEMRIMSEMWPDPIELKRVHKWVAPMTPIERSNYFDEINQIRTSDWDGFWDAVQKAKALENPLTPPIK